MKKTITKAVLAATLLFSAVLGQAGITDAEAANATTVAPIMRDNLSKFGLKKDVELPVTVTAGGLSYTLEKIMIYDANSRDAQALIKKYKYQGTGKYFVWTKITIENKGKDTIEQTAKSPEPKWLLAAADGGIFSETMPRLNVRVKNSKDALWDFTLKPGQKLTTYQGLMYQDSNFDFFVVRLNVKGNLAVKFIVNRKETGV